MSNIYTDQQVTDALAALELNSGNVKRTALQIGVPRPTLILWRNRAAEVSGIVADTPDTVKAEKPHDFAAIWADTLEEVMTLLREKAPTASFRDLSIFAGIAADKHLDYTQGRKGAGTTVNAAGMVQVVIE